MENSTTKSPRHHGRNIGRLRYIVGMKQETLAEKLGISQQSVSKLEQSETIEDRRLEEVAKALGIDSDAIKNFSEESIFNIQNNYEGSNQGATVSAGNGNFHECTFNPLDELKKAWDENKRLSDALLKEKDEKISLMQKMLDMKK